MAPSGILFNFGGLWEAGVKATKLHLKRVIGEFTLTYEELSIFLTQILPVADQ